MDKKFGVELDSGSGEIRFPKVNEEGYPVDPNKVPSYEEALRIIREIDYLLNKRGTGSKSRIAKAAAVARRADDYEVWTRNILNKDGGLFPIANRSKGTYMDPASESYHSM